MIIPSALPIFPNCPSYGFHSRPQFDVMVTERTGGYEKRNLLWEEPMYFYDGVPMGPRREDDIYRIWKFYHARRATHRRFRFIDYVDYKSTEDMGADVTASDQPFVALGGSQYQLVKQYEDDSGEDPLLRTIIHPRGASIIVSNNLAAVQAPSTWTINENTGVLTVGVGFVGTPGGWGGEFYVPARFAAAIDVVIEDKRIQSLSCTLKSLRPQDT